MTAKILVLSYERVPGIDAAGQHLSLLLPSLSRYAEIDALSLKCDELGHIQRMGTARILRVPSSSPVPSEQVAAFERAVHRQLEAESYDVVWCSDLISAHAVATHGSQQGQRLIVDLFELPSQTFCARHGIVDRDGQIARTLRRQEVIALRAAHRVLVHSQVLRQALLALNVPPDRVEVLPIAIDTRIFSPPSIEIPSDPNACAVGIVLEPFGLDLLRSVLELWKTLPKRLQAVVIRDAPDGGEVAALLDELELGKRSRVEHAGTPERLAELLGGIDVVLCWSTTTDANETLGRIPMAALSALFAGRPVVGVDSISARELLGEANAKLRVAPGDLAGVGAKLAELATSSAARKRLATRGREAASRHVDGERYLELTRQAIEQSIGRELPALRGADGPIDSASSYVPERAAGYVAMEVQHTPVLPKPLPPASPPASPQEVPEPPAPRAVSLSDAVDGATSGADPWEHDTIATPMEPHHFDGSAAPPGPATDGGRDASLRSMALLEQVSGQEGMELQTEIRGRHAGDSSMLGSGQETERLDVSESLLQHLQSAPLRAAVVTGLDDETLRLPAFRPEAAPASSGRAVPVPVFEDEGVDSKPYRTGVADEVTDRDQVGSERSSRSPAAPNPRKK